MLYSIPFSYYEFSEGKSQIINAQLVMNLPQDKLSDAKYNLLVRDLVLYAHIRCCYLSDTNYKERPESILQEYKKSNFANTVDIRVVYQKEPNLNVSYWNLFVCHINMETDGNINLVPFREINFTCRHEYYAYREAFLRNYIIGNTLNIIPNYKNGNLLKVYNGLRYDLGKVFNDSGAQKIQMIGSASGTICINNDTSKHITPIDVTDDLLSLLEARLCYRKINENTCCMYELSLSNGIILNLIVQDERQYLVVEDSINENNYHLTPFVGLHGLQNAVQDEYGVLFVPSKIKEIEIYIKNLHREMLFIMNYPKLIDSFGKDTENKYILDAMMTKFGIDKDFANHYLIEYKNRGK